MEAAVSRAVPPHSLDAERSVLGAMMQDPAAVALAVELLAEEDFYAPHHRELYSAMRALNTLGSPVDLITVDSELGRKGTLEGIGGTAYLIEVSQYVPTTANVRAYIAIVSEKSTLRRLITASQQISAECYAQQEPLKDILNHAEKAVFDIVMRRASGESLVKMDQILTSTYEKVEELSRLKGKLSGVPTDFYDLDNLLTGMHPGELILIGARPSMGKTALAANIAQNACFRHGKTAAIFSLEMPREQLAMRMLCSEARINLQKIRSGTLRDEDWLQLSKVLGPMAASPMYIDDTAGLTPSQLRSRCRRLMMDKGLDLVVVDYLQLMGSDKRSENRQLEVSEISRQLKSIALELRVPLIACAQLSRALASRQDKRPVLSDLRDSGSIEQDADIVMFIHREGYYTGLTSGQEDTTGELILSKQRNGPLGVVKVGWFSEYATYTNPAGFQ